MKYKKISLGLFQEMKHTWGKEESTKLYTRNEIRGIARMEVGIWKLREL
jgi:hypothetical protein